MKSKPYNILFKSPFKECLFQMWILVCSTIQRKYILGVYYQRNGRPCVMSCNSDQVSETGKIENAT
jgi:hypothetical protein